jgi:hypothetical protein
LGLGGDGDGRVPAARDVLAAEGGVLPDDGDDVSPACGGVWVSRTLCGWIKCVGDDGDGLGGGAEGGWGFDSPEQRSSG